MEIFELGKGYAAVPFAPLFSLKEAFSEVCKLYTKEDAAVIDIMILDRQSRDTAIRLLQKYCRF